MNRKTPGINVISSSSTERMFTLFVGVISIAAFGVAIYQTYYSFNAISSCDLRSIGSLFWPLASSIAFLVICFTFFAFFSHRSLVFLKKSYIDVNPIVDEASSRGRIITCLSQCNHNYLHYLRDIILVSSKINTRILAGEQIEEPEIENILYQFRGFITNTLNDTKNLFDKITKDNCSTCIKLLSSENKVKTLYRDSSSFRKRRTFDIDENHKSKVYKTDDNTAFAKIVDINESGNIFISDDLFTDNIKKRYKNSNRFWQDLYNAVAVVPISSVLDKKMPKNRTILGFLCVDNMEGGFEYSQNEEILAALGDSMYILFDSISGIIEYSIGLGVEHDVIDKFCNWDNG